ncbi:MAG: histidine kinase [Clostridia bacterium]|nr:histidine kinase [Clostridia bacterium]
MAARLFKDKISVKSFSVFLSLVIFYCVFVAAIFTFNVFYQEIYDTPRVFQGAVDYGGIDLNRSRRLTARTLSGEWEFFYNRWIITDGGEGENDGYLSVPGRWTGLTVGGEKLPRSGFASYRLTVKNFPAGEVVTCFADNSVVALRMFVNGKLCSVSGTVSKDGSETSSGNAERVDYCISDGGDITIVIETGYTATGGLTHAPSLSQRMTPSAYWVFIERFVVVMLGLVAGTFFAALIMTLGFMRYDRDFTLPVLIGTLCLHFFFSKDVTKAIGLYGYGAVCIPALITGILTAAVFVVHILKLSDGLNKNFLIAYAAAGGVSAIAYGALYGTVYTVIPAIIFLFVSLFPLYNLAASKKIQPKFKTVYLLIYLLTICILTFEIIDGAGLLAFGMEYIFAGLLALVIFAQSVVAFLRLYNLARKLIRMNELEREVERTKLRTLAAQIKPHFIFNSLTAIQSRYHKDLGEGDVALQNFARHLRSNIDASEGGDLIAFNAEIQNVLNYFDLENLRADGALNLLLDLNERNFSVPSLSLQPFVENAVKYADTQSVKGGHIKISSERIENAVKVEIADNGIGFDVGQPQSGVGIKNSCERFKQLLGAEVEIQSNKGKGTRVTVVIPVKEDNS